jgi:hypothetical protein
MNQGRMAFIRQRFQWGSYGFLPGIILGIILGWLFHGVVSWIVRFGIVFLLLIPIVAVLFVWWRLSSRNRSDGTIETRSTIVEYRPGRQEE